MRKAAIGFAIAAKSLTDRSKRSSCEVALDLMVHHPRATCKASTHGAPARFHAQSASRIWPLGAKRLARPVAELGVWGGGGCSDLKLPFRECLLRNRLERVTRG